MNFLLDQGLPRSTVAHLAAAGVAAQHVGVLGMATASDQQILDLARQNNSVVVTLDADFHRLLAANKATAPSVVRIRLQGIKGDALATILLEVIKVVGSELVAGAAVSVTSSRLRIRMLPIGK
jgi:predicted nuclease of predicted toxin-antitoxin system